MAAKTKEKTTPAEAPQPAAAPSWIDRHADKIAYALMAVTAVMALLLFNVRVSEGGDDSTYICRALDFITDGTYPSFQGPLYPLFLSLFISIMGSVNLVALKLSSLVLLIGGQAMMYFSLRKTVSKKLLLAVLLVMAFNPWFLQFGSLTYSEALFYFLQWCVVGFLLRLEGQGDDVSVRKTVLYAVLVGLFVVLCYLTRTVGFVWGVAAVVYLLVRRKWRMAVMVLAACGVMFGVWIGVRTAVWGAEVGNGNQLQTLLQVDPYNPEEGMETVGGFAMRFFENSRIYISKYYMRMLGLHSPTENTLNTFVTILIYAFSLFGLYCGYKKNRGVLLVGIAAALLLFVTFCSLQVMWDQVRLIVPYVALIHIVMFYGLANILGKSLGTLMPKIFTIAVCLCTFVLIAFSVKTIDIKTTKANLTNDILLGYTPDWYNYLSLCSAIGKNQDADNMYVACRKPNMARIYADGKKFYGIYTIPSEDPDVLVQNLKDHGVTHVIVASLRRNPQQAGQGVINTIHRYAGFIVNKYPQFLELVAVAGFNYSIEGRQVTQEEETRFEPAYLYKIHYENATAK